MSATIPNTKSKKSKKSKKFDNLLGPTDPKVDNQAREKLVTARVGLLLRHSFFGNLATRLQLINADEWCPTPATDGRRFYYNSRFVNLLKTKELEFLFGHEVLHCVYDHMDRRGTRDPQMFNIANDYAVNADLKRHNVGQFITSVPCLYEKKYENMTSEAIYDELMQNASKLDLDDILDQMIDEHLDGEGDDGEGDEGDGDGNKDKKGGKRPKMSDEEREQIKQDMKQAIINAASTADAGSLPKGVQQLIKDITSPVMPWRDLLQVNLTSSIKTDFSFSRPSRRGWHMDAILPAMTPGEEIDIDVFLDVSGSCVADCKYFLSEVIGMMQMFDSYRINVSCFDTEVYNTQTFTNENSDKIDEYTPVGGGGTDFTCMFDFLKREGREPKRMIVFTDGMPYGSWGDENYCDTTWIIKGTSVTPPFGSWAYYDEQQK